MEFNMLNKKLHGTNASPLVLSLVPLVMGATVIAYEPVAQAATVDTVRVWVAPGFSGANNPADLADWFASTSLWVDTNNDGAVEAVSSGVFNAQTNSISNSNIRYTKTGRKFKSANGFIADIWQVEFTHLGLHLPGKGMYKFGVKGIGRSIPGSSATTPGPDYYPWFLLAANEAEAGFGPLACADGHYYEYLSNGKVYNSVKTPNGRVNSVTVKEWNKTSDILVQVLDSAGLFQTNRGLPSMITTGNTTRWAPPESIYSRVLPGGGVTTNQTARFKGDEFKTGMAHH
jgi:hypothetical protein